MFSHNFIYVSKIKMAKETRIAKEQNFWEVIDLFSPA